MRKDITAMMKYETILGLCLLACTLLIELAGYVLRYQIGVWFSGYVLPVYAWLPFAFTRQHPLSSSFVGYIFVLFGLVSHIQIVAKQLMRLQKDRLYMRLRKPSKQEYDQVEGAYKSMRKKGYSVPGFHYPDRFRVFQGEGHRVRFVGNVLVIDVALFQMIGSPYLGALLAQALWDYNGPWIYVRRVLQGLPDSSWLPIGFVGRWATWMGWQLYRRYHVYNADAYAVMLGQKQPLITTLEEVCLPIDEPREKFFYDEPYVELRIDHLHKLS